MGKILAMKKLPKIDLNKAKILFQKRFFTCLKNIQNNLSPFLCEKTIKECPVPLDISIKSNRKHHKTVLYSKSNKNMVGQLLGRFFVFFGRFFHKNIWSPCLPGTYTLAYYRHSLIKIEKTIEHKVLEPES